MGDALRQLPSAWEAALSGFREKDERNHIVTLTEAGQALKQRAAFVPGQMAACIRMEPEDALQLYTLLHRLLDTMQEGNDRAE